MENVVVGKVVRSEDVDVGFGGEDDPGVDLVMAEGAGESRQAQEYGEQEQTCEQDDSRRQCAPGLGHGSNRLNW